ncbi:DNA-binding protein [Photorhabdus akhurstii]|uniref:helix-turn-helix domain-containing transcriptional regulator n=1 Tax=Photorhabdus akhurstii TaxID=171438 RepID=UPI0006204BDB|nr:hypothetical protein [Photorhabdus akhurstii]MBS9427736.1 transcriptional regulator [Photorhabdus akhurstii]
MDKSVKNKSAIEHLSPELNEDRKTQDVRLLLETARQVAEAHGGLSFIAKETGLSRESLYRALSATGNPTIRTQRKVYLRKTIHQLPGYPIVRKTKLTT